LILDIGSHGLDLLDFFFRPHQGSRRILLPLGAATRRRIP
jgi:hypothetical protein